MRTKKIILIFVCILVLISSYEFSLLVSNRTQPKQPSIVKKALETPIPQPTKTVIPVPAQVVTTQASKPTYIPRPIATTVPILSGANIFYFINGYRSQNGKPELQLSDELCQLAQYRASLMLNEDPRLEKSSLMNHYKFSELMDRYSGNTIGENLYTSQHNGDVDAITAWKSSPAHNQMMLATTSPNGTVYTHGCVKTDSNTSSNAAVFLIGDK